jgi:hypothetical protein
MIQIRAHALLDCAVGAILATRDAPAKARRTLMLADLVAPVYRAFTCDRWPLVRRIPSRTHSAPDAGRRLFFLTSRWRLGFAGAIRGPRVAAGTPVLAVTAPTARGNPAR